MAPFRRGRSAQPAPPQESAFEARRRRKQSSGTKAPEKSNNRRKEKLPDDEYDPYDSDPGESYRDHCMRIKGTGTRSCLGMPRFLKRDDETTVATSPPSPLASENDEFNTHNNTPASLPRDLARVRYSLRTSIGDGTEKQPTGPSVMERRELRPNNVHINCSHWSDFGGRNYMEDRCVRYHRKLLYSKPYYSI
jgi:hypothetical protein